MAYIKILLDSTFQIFYKITFYLCNMNIFAMLIPQEPNTTLVGLFIVQRVHQVWRWATCAWLIHNSLNLAKYLMNRKY